MLGPAHSTSQSTRLNQHREVNMKAIIVAAGMSSRLYPLTNELPKGLLKIGGRSIIERSIDLLNAVGINDVIVVVGYHHEKLRAALRGRARFVMNPFYEKTN